MLRTFISQSFPRTSMRPLARASVATSQVLLPARHARYNSSKSEGAPEVEPEAPEEKKASKARDRQREWLDRQDALQKDWDAKVLTYEELKPKTQQPSPKSYIIDVREPDEVLQGSIPSSVNLPLSVLANALHMHPSAFKERFGWEKPTKNQEIIFYCRSGKRSTSACDIAKRNFYTNVYNYKGSWLDWISREGNNKSS